MYNGTDMSDLTDALDVWDQTLGPTQDLLPETTKVIVDAARKVANLDIEAAASILAYNETGGHPHSAHTKKAKRIVNAALGITDDE